MTTKWYFQRGGEQFGPVSAEQLKRHAASGQLKPTDLVWKEGLANWVTASRIKGLFPERCGAVPPPPSSRQGVAQGTSGTPQQPSPSRSLMSQPRICGQTPAAESPRPVGGAKLLGQFCAVAQDKWRNLTRGQKTAACVIAGATSAVLLMAAAWTLLGDRPDQQSDAVAHVYGGLSKSGDRIASDALEKWAKERSQTVRQVTSEAESAAQNGDISSLKQWFQTHSDLVNAQTSTGATLLYVAAASKHRDIVQFLLEKGADPNAANRDQATPLHGLATLWKMVSKDIPGIARLLIRNGADVEAQDSQQQTPLYSAVLCSVLYKQENLGLVAFLLANGADVNTRNDKGTTPLHLAADRRRKNLLDLLLKNGADVNARDGDGVTPLTSALAGTFRPDKAFEIAKTLLDRGAKVNVADQSGNTPLHLAAKHQYAGWLAPILDALLARGADVNARNSEGATPLHVVALTDTAKRLLAHGASLNALDNQRRTPLQTAGRRQVGNFLRSKGAST